MLVRNVASFVGGITNAGTITSATNGNFSVNAITVGTTGVSGAVSTFIGGITNTGTISGFANAIAVANVRTLAGGHHQQRQYRRGRVWHSYHQRSWLLGRDREYSRQHDQRQ